MTRRTQEQIPRLHCKRSRRCSDTLPQKPGRAVLYGTYQNTMMMIPPSTIIEGVEDWEPDPEHLRQLEGDNKPMYIHQQTVTVKLSSFGSLPIIRVIVYLFLTQNKCPMAQLVRACDC